MAFNPHPSTMIALAEERVAGLHAEAERCRMAQPLHSEARSWRLHDISVVIVVSLVALFAARVAAL